MFGEAHIVPASLEIAKDGSDFPLRNFEETAACRLANALEVRDDGGVVEWAFMGDVLSPRFAVIDDTRAP